MKVTTDNKLRYSLLLLFLFLTNTVIFAQQDTRAARLATIRFGTEVEIGNLIQTIRNENADEFDEELIALAETTRNQRILTGIFGFFADREVSGLEDRAMRAIEERDDETNETILSAIEYLGRVRHAPAAPILMDLLDTEERRFLNAGFRALGRVASADSEMAGIAADFLLDFYENRDPGSDNAREVIVALGATGSKKALPLLIDIVTNPDERFPLRMAGLDALALIGDEAGLEAVLSAVSANDPNVRASAVRALGPFSGEAVDRAILDGFRDSFFRTRIAAAQASRDRKLEAAVPYLQFRAERDDVPQVREESIRALGVIASEEAMEVLNTLFRERRNSDRVRLVSAEMLMQNAGEQSLTQIIIEMDYARGRNQTALYNGFLRITGEAVITGDTSGIESLARRFMQNGGVLERLFGLDMAANNNLTSLEAEIKTLAEDRNESIARRARRTAERLGIDLDEEES